MKAPFLLFIAFACSTVLFGISIDLHNSKGVIISLVGMAMVVFLAATHITPKYRKYAKQKANL